MISDQPLSDFGQFHMRYKGKKFVREGFIYPKYIIWWNFIKAGIQEKNLPILFHIKDKPGWKDGKIINRELAGFIREN